MHAVFVTFGFEIIAEFYTKVAKMVQRPLLYLPPKSLLLTLPHVF